MGKNSFKNNSKAPVSTKPAKLPTNINRNGKNTMRLRKQEPK